MLAFPARVQVEMAQVATDPARGAAECIHRFFRDCAAFGEGLHIDSGRLQTTAPLFSNLLHLRNTVNNALFLTWRKERPKPLGVLQMNLSSLSEARYIRRRYFPKMVLILGLTGVAFPGPSAAQGGEARRIDTGKSTMTVHVYRAGALAVFGHDHEITAPIAGGGVDTAGRHVELRVNAAALRVRDPNASEKDRAEIQKTMLGPDVLDAEQHREILFKSTAVEKAGDGWTVRGNLTLHGQTKTVAVEVREAQEGHYTGSARLRQTDFGIKPVKVAGGTVRVKDELRIDFDIQLAR